MSDQADDPAHRARTAVARLELVSHGTISNYNGLVRIGDKPARPAGGVRYQDDREPDFPQKSHVYFRRRLRRCYTDEDYERLADEAEQALWAWQHTPETAEPEIGSLNWKLWVARSDMPAHQIAKRDGVNRKRIAKIRKAYREGGISSWPDTRRNVA